MRTQDVKIEGEYLYKEKIVIVKVRIQGKSKKVRSIWADQNPHMQKKFLLDNGEKVFAKELTKLTQE